MVYPCRRGVAVLFTRLRFKLKWWPFGDKTSSSPSDISIALPESWVVGFANAFSDNWDDVGLLIAISDY